MAIIGIIGLLVLVVVPVIATLTGGGSAPSGSPVDLGNYYYDQAINLWDAADYAGALDSLQQAATYYEQALTQTPENAQVRTDLGAVYFYQSRLLSDTVLLQQAIATWQVALEYEPDKPETLFNMGLGYADLGAVDQAIAFWQRVIEVAPGSDAAQSAEQLIQEYSGVIGP
jgi:tetratricopeptide (TPR) repeat protein